MRPLARLALQKRHALKCFRGAGETDAYFASQGIGIHFEPFGSILKCVLVMNG